MSARYRAAVDAAAIFSETDKSGIITYVNEQFCDISGYSAQELIGQNHRILNSGQQPPEFFIVGRYGKVKFATVKRMAACIG